MKIRANTVQRAYVCVYGEHAESAVENGSYAHTFTHTHIFTLKWVKVSV